MRCKDGNAELGQKIPWVLLRAGLRIPLMTGYVDGGRQGGTVLRRGMRFDEQVGEFVMDEEQLKPDEEENEPDNMRKYVCPDQEIMVDPRILVPSRILGWL